MKFNSMRTISAKTCTVGGRATVFTTDPKQAHVRVNVTSANRTEVNRLAEKQTFGKGRRK